ncbi:MAG: glycine--tRNA ligase [archaeon]|nr:glycine--tRNA ligase [archaeon]
MLPDSSDIMALCRRRGFIWPSFEVYGGVAGMFDYGPLGCILKNNIVGVWRSIYRGEEKFLEIDSETINPRDVFKASGHVDGFADLITYCQKCQTPFRADHLVEGFCKNPDTLTPKQLEDTFVEHNVKCPECGGNLGQISEFNLMFKTSIGPGSTRTGYLRPETAQGIFVNYLNLYRYNREKLPFGVIQIGKSYRNEIAPRQGMLRMREFSQMEAELFIDPENKDWPKFKEVENEELDLIPNTTLELTTMTVGEAVEKGVIANRVLAYFVYVTKQFLTIIGVDPKRLRFREHEKDEMAHYATDCWDAEVLLSYGWVEIVGIADRGCWDLSRHAQFSGQDMTHFRRYDSPKEVEVSRVKAKSKAIGPRFKGRAKDIISAIESLKPEDVRDGKVFICVDNEKIELDDEFFEVISIKEKIAGDRVIPHVIEPSHGLDRILYSVLEHAYEHDNEENYTTLNLRPVVAPIKVGVFPLMAKDGLDEVAHKIYTDVCASGMEAYYDDSGTIGKRYARMDEIGTPWCITVDYETIEDGLNRGTVTIRDRNTKGQKRVQIKDIEKILERLLSGEIFDIL